MDPDDDMSRPTDLRTKMVAIVLILCLVAGVAPFVLDLLL